MCRRFIYFISIFFLLKIRFGAIVVVVCIEKFKKENKINTNLTAMKRENADNNKIQTRNNGRNYITQESTKNKKLYALFVGCV